MTNDHDDNRGYRQLRPGNVDRVDARNTGGTMDTWAMLEALMFDRSTPREDRMNAHPVWLGRPDVTVHGPLTPTEACAAVATLPPEAQNEVHIAGRSRQWRLVKDLPRLLADPRPEAPTVPPGASERPVASLRGYLDEVRPNGIIAVRQPQQTRMLVIDNGSVRTELGTTAWFIAMRSIFKSELFEKSGVLDALYESIDVNRPLVSVATARNLESYLKALEITMRKNARALLDTTDGTFVVVSGRGA